MSRRARVPPDRQREAGFALLVVLSMLLLVALIAIRISLLGRSEVRIATNLKNSATAEAAADGGVFEAIDHLLAQGDGRWVPRGNAHQLQIGGYRVAVRTENEAGKINPNLASAELLEALLVALKVDAAHAAVVAQAIVDWRMPAPDSQSEGRQDAAYQAAGRKRLPEHKPFVEMDDVGAVLGMTPELFDRLTPYLTLYSSAPPNPADATPLVANVLSQLPTSPPLVSQSNNTALPQRPIVTTIAADAQGDGSFNRIAVAQIDLNGGYYKILAWHRGFSKLTLPTGHPS